MVRRQRSTALIHNDELGGQQTPLTSTPARSPSNGLTQLTAAFVSNIDISIDINIQLVWNFGVFLREVPRRLGVNEALDTASDALITAYTWYTGSRDSPISHMEVLFKYSRTLKALRLCLNDPVKAHSSETLCSIMLIQII